MYILVSPFDRSFDDIWFTYFVPDFLQESIFLWVIVEIPFWKNIIYWVVLEIKEKIEENLNIKSIISVIYKNKFLYDYQIELIKWIASNYFCLIHQVLYMFFPKNLLEKIKKGKFNMEENKILKYEENIDKTLTIEQKKIYGEIIKSSENKIFLFWITGSGKTEIYVNLIKKYLSLDKQILLLVPEIILTSQLADYLKKVFWNDLIVLNSRVSEAKKTNYWISIYSWNAKIIVWTRSSLFYPYKNLWIIIVDEEHDNSYNSDNNPRFNSIEVVEKISELLDIKVIFASGTPSVNNMYKAIRNKYKILNLFEEIK